MPCTGPGAGSSPKLALRSITGHRRILNTGSGPSRWEQCSHEAKWLHFQNAARSEESLTCVCAASSQSASAAAQLSCRLFFMMLCVQQTFKQQLLLQGNLHDLGHSAIVLSPVLRPCSEEASHPRSLLFPLAASHSSSLSISGLRGFGQSFAASLFAGELGFGSVSSDSQGCSI